MRWPAFAIPLLLLTPWPIAAHGDISELVRMFDALIEKYPDKADLFLKRGDCRRANHEWASALEDYDRAERLNPALPGLDLFKGLALIEGRKWDSARDALDRFLSTEPDHVAARLSRARALVALGQPLAAAADYSHAIAQSPEPRPEYYIDRAHALAGQGRTMAALNGLDEGIARLGPIVTLELAAIDLELANRRFDEGLARLDRLARQGDRQESWLARRGRILESAGRPEEAGVAYRAALAAIDSVPPSRRRAASTLDLETQLLSALNALASEDSHDRK